LSGQVWPLERVPDPVFAQKMAGDGLSVDPTDAMLVAGCDGEVISLHPAGHALTLRTPSGVEVLMHRSSRSTSTFSPPTPGAC
jgi:phosphotransferase system IIA component